MVLGLDLPLPGSHTVFDHLEPGQLKKKSIHCPSGICLNAVEFRANSTLYEEFLVMTIRNAHFDSLVGVDMCFLVPESEVGMLDFVVLGVGMPPVQGRPALPGDNNPDLHTGEGLHKGVELLLALSCSDWFVLQKKKKKDNS